MPQPVRPLAFLVLLAGGFLPPVDFFIVNVALPSIQHELSADAAAVQLVIAGYAAGYAVFLITGGRLGDLFGRKRAFLLGMAGFTAASALCGLAPGPGWLIGGRIAEGLAAALLAPQVLGSIRALYTGPALVRALSLYGAMMGLAAATGQFAGGALIAWNPFGLGWRAVFLINLPIGLWAILTGMAVVPETSASYRPRLDLAGAAWLSLALFCLVVPLSEGQEHGWPAWMLAMLAVAPLAILGFLRQQARLAARGGMPLLDLSLFAIAGFRRGAAIALLFFFTTAFYLLFAIYQQEGRGLDPLHTGLSILPYGIGLFLGPLASAPFAGGTRGVWLRPRLLAGGLALEVAGYAATAALIGFQAPAMLVPFSVLATGFGQGIAMPRLYNSALEDVPAQHGGVAAAVINSALQVGAAISAAAIGSLFFAVLGSGQGPAAYGHAFGIAMIALVAALAGAAVIAAWPVFARAAPQS